MGRCTIAEDLREKAEQSYSSLFQHLVEVKKDMVRARDAYVDLEDSIAEGTEEAWRVYKEQVGIIASDLDLSPLNLDKVVIYGAIVSPPRPEDVPSSSKAPETFPPSPMDVSLLDSGGAPTTLPGSGGDVLPK
ncbi:uncharacterized protein DS421_13g439130 [Arachis hypogaea]|nr:uncharacterized protein DS421_13g439130 [Arachis hypogaea]